MNDAPETIDEILQRLQAGHLDVADARQKLAALTAQPLGFATVDHARADRCGAAEVIVAAGKQPEQVASIARAIYERQGHVFITRAATEHIQCLQSSFDGASLTIGKQSRAILIGQPKAQDVAAIPIVTAGTSDEPVAEEAHLTCQAMGHLSTAMNDVGVAGLHRLGRHLDDLRRANVIVCIAGMEGALPSVIGGLVDAPVIGVPTSVGYGAALGGMTAMLSMLTACAAGLAVVNIDNGFGAAHVACMINRLAARDHK